MIRIYENWYQLNDNGLWNKRVTGEYRAKDLERLCLGGKAHIDPDGDTIYFVSCSDGYKLKLSDHDPKEQNDIVDILTPIFQDL